MTLAPQAAAAAEVAAAGERVVLAEGGEGGDGEAQGWS